MTRRAVTQTAESAAWARGVAGSSPASPRIPKRFQLFGQTIEVVYDSVLTAGERCSGQARFLENRIVLDSGLSDTKRASQTVEHVFYHELVHWILNVLDEESLNNNEKLINQFAYALHQAITTMEY